VIVPDAVAMVDLDGDGSSPPLYYATFFASVFEHAESQQRPLDGEAAFRLRHHFFERPLARSRLEIAARYGFPPRAG
jgi:hypothetical protein